MQADSFPTELYTNLNNSNYPGNSDSGFVSLVFMSSNYLLQETTFWSLQTKVLDICTLA